MRVCRSLRTPFVALFLVIVAPSYAGKAELTSHTQMMTRLASLESVDNLFGNRRVKVLVIGRSSKGKEIPMVTISSGEGSFDAKKRLFVICRQHGDEPAPTEAMLSLIEDLAFAQDSASAELLSKLALFVVPMVNPDGADSGQRRNASGVDINRDWLQLSQPETRCVRAAIDAVSPDVLVDQHELSPNNTRSDFVETAGVASGAPPELIAESVRLQELVVGMLRTHDIEVMSYQIQDSNPPRLAHRYFPLNARTVTLLFETRQAGIRQHQLEYRMRLHIVGTMTIAKYLAGRGDELRQRIERYDDWQRSVQLASRSKKRNAQSADLTK